jgi:adenylate cyclase
MDFAAAGLLDGLEGDERRAREQLLERLLADGFSPDELRSAVAENRLALLPVEQVLGGRYTAAEIEAETGTPAALMLWMRRLLGLPEAGEHDRVFGSADFEAARSTKLFLDAGLAEDALVEVTRVLGEAMARLAATTAAAFADSFLEPGDSEDAVAVRFAALAEKLMPALAPVLIAAFSAHLRESVSRGMIGRAELTAGQLAGAQEMTICFADLVGFTRLGGEVEVQELGSVAGRLAELAAGVTTPRVRLVKTIGDAAMFVSADPAAQVEAALTLVEAVEQAELPSLRAGIALGPALQRAGDFFGHSVNLASRVTGFARPGSVLVTEEVRDAAGDRFSWSNAGRHRFKGVAEPVPLYRARRPPAPGDAAEGPADASAAEPAETDEETDRRRARRERKATKRRADRPRK